MTFNHANIGDLVGAGLFFEHVSARAAYDLPAMHDRGLVIGSGQRHTYPTSDGGMSFEYFANERAINWNGYDGDPANQILPAADKRVLLGALDKLRILGPVTVSRTSTAANVLLDGSDESATTTAINADLLTASAATAFPAFDLFATNFGAQPIDAATAGAYPTVQIIGNAALGANDLVKTFWPPALTSLPRTGPRDHWLVWMKPAANITANSGVAIWMAGLTGGK
ncbi:MAG: hypothetical protein AAFQ58_19225 [Pseudomonadota bacterium]